MRKALPALIFILLATRLCAQQLPQYTQYTFNELLINPAVTGIESYWDVKTGYRSQWTGLQGAPKTGYITASLPINRDFSLNDYSQVLRNSDNPNGKGDAASYRASPSHGGIGLSIIDDKAGAFKQLHVDFNYAYHMRVSDQFNISVGASAGFNNIGLNVDELEFATPIDPVVSQGANSRYAPEAGLGVWAYGPTFFIGASAQQLIPQSINFSNSSSTGKAVSNAQYYFTTGFKIYTSGDVTLLPSVVVRPNPAGPLTYDLNMKLAFRDDFWVGGAYRSNDAVAASFGFNLGSFMSIGYSYDRSISELSTVSSGTHEIVIALFLNNNYNTTSPRHTW